jgi:sodium-dependent phosphate transporter
MGANDCANSYGTSVGAGVLKLWQAYLLATVFEVAGAALLGYKVTNTIRRGIVDIDYFTVHSLYAANYTGYCLVDNCGSNATCPSYSNYTNFNVTATTNEWSCSTYTKASYTMSALGALIGSAAWLLLATLAKLPVSTTHSTIGATVGGSLVLGGATAVNWVSLGKVVASWLISPILSGLFSIFVYAFIKLFSLNTKNPLRNAINCVPVLLLITVFVNVFSIMYHGSKYLHFDTLAWWIDGLVALAVGTAAAVMIRVFASRPIEKMAERRVREHYEAKNRTELRNAHNGTLKNNAGAELPPNDVQISTVLKDYRSDGIESVMDDQWTSGSKCCIGTDKYNPSVKERINHLVTPCPEPVDGSMVYTALQILSSIFLSFSHGSNDTANAVGPLLAVWTTYKTGYALSTSQDDVNEGLIIYGALAMIVGLWCLGHKVIKAVGEDLTEMTPARGFSMEIGTSFTVLFCSKLGIPVSTTHCIIGAVVAVGWFRARSGVSWRLFGKMALAWVVTLPVAGLVSALFTWLFLFTL